MHTSHLPEGRAPRRPVASEAARWPLIGLISLLAGCESNHDLLVERTSDASVAPEAAGVVDVAGDERRVSTGDTIADTIQKDEGATVDVPPEPPGTWSLRWTNGLADVPTARFCLVPVVGGIEARDGVLPFPVGGLGFGKSVIFGGAGGMDAGVGGIDWTKTEVHPYLIVGARDDAGAALESCRALIEESEARDGSTVDDAALGGPLAIALPIVPAGALGAPQSYLGVVTGCARPWPFTTPDAGTDGSVDALDADDAPDAPGAPDALDRDARPIRDARAEPDVDDANDGASADVVRPPTRESVCGEARTPNIVLVQLSRHDVGAAYGMQGVLASVATSSARIALEATNGTALFAVNVALGQIAPRPIPTFVAPSDLEPSLGAATLRITAPGGSLAVSLGAALTASDLSETSISPGDTMTFVVIGGLAGLDVPSPWNAARVLVVPNPR